MGEPQFYINVMDECIYLDIQKNYRIKLLKFNNLIACHYIFKIFYVLLLMQHRRVQVRNYYLT